MALFSKDKVVENEFQNYENTFSESGIVKATLKLVEYVKPFAKSLGGIRFHFENSKKEKAFYTINLWTKTWHFEASPEKKEKVVNGFFSNLDFIGNALNPKFKEALLYTDSPELKEVQGCIEKAILCDWKGDPTPFLQKLVEGFKEAEGKEFYIKLCKEFETKEDKEKHSNNYKIIFGFFDTHWIDIDAENLKEPVNTVRWSDEGSMDRTSSETHNSTQNTVNLEQKETSVVEAENVEELPF